MVLVSLGYSPSPANALFGLDKCSKVKKEILANEAQIAKSMKEITPWNMAEVSGGLDEKVSLEVKYLGGAMSLIWKSVTNNPKCFTNTQRLASKKGIFEPRRYVKIISWGIGGTISSSTWEVLNQYLSIYSY